MTIRNKKISQVRFDKTNLDPQTVNRALDNVINTINPWVDDATQAINDLQTGLANVNAVAGVITITPQGANSITGQSLIFSGSGGISFTSDADKTLTIVQQPVTIAASDTAGFGQGNSIGFSGSGGATVTRSGTTITINPNIPITSVVGGTNINTVPAGTTVTVNLNDPISLTTITGSNITSSNFIGWANKTVKPYGVFCDLTTQTASNTTTAYPMNLDTTEEAIGVSIVSGSRITFAYDGVYNIQFSAQVAKNNASAADVDIWLSETGSNVPRSNTNLHIVGNNAANVAAWNFVRTFPSGSYAEIMWRTSDTDVELLYENSASSPTRPEIPSVIVTVSQV